MIGHRPFRAAIAALAQEGKDVARAIKLFKIDSDKPNPLGA